MSYRGSKMTIKRRFLLTYVGAIIITLTSIVGILALSSYTTLGKVPTLTQAYKMLTQQRDISPKEEKSYAELVKLAQQTPTILVDPQAAKLQEKLAEIEQKGLLVALRKQNHFSYYSPELVEKSLYVHAPAYELNNLHPTGTLDNAGRLYRYLKFDFRYPDQSKGSIFILKRESNLFEFFTRWGIWVIVTIIALGIWAAWWLNRRLQKSTITPLEQLGRASQEFRPLEFAPKQKVSYEVKQLQESFNQSWYELQAAARQQEQSEQKKKELLANISHDLKTPMTSIIGYVEGLLDGVANTPQKQRHYLEVIHAKSLSLNELLEELFLYTKLDSGEMSLKLKKLDLSELVKQTLTQAAKEQDFELRLVILAQPLNILGDAFQLKRVLTNLLQNSLKFADPTKEKCCITVKLSRADKLARLDFSDNGIGIAKEELDYVFERFYRVDKARSIKGSGLGLSIVKQIIDKQQGKVELTSQLHVGTTVSIYLPLVKKEGTDER